jgi:hypothetical protein
MAIKSISTEYIFVADKPEDLDFVEEYARQKLEDSEGNDYEVRRFLDGTILRISALVSEKDILEFEGMFSKDSLRGEKDELDDIVKQPDNTLWDELVD